MGIDIVLAVRHDTHNTGIGLVERRRENFGRLGDVRAKSKGAGDFDDVGAVRRSEHLLEDVDRQGRLLLEE